MKYVRQYRLRLKRKGRLWRAIRRQSELTSVVDRTSEIKRGDILCFCTLRNERIRLPYFFEYYRKLGVDHFLIVDNGSGDGSHEFLADQPDVSLWSTEHSYRQARYGMDWLNGLLRRYGHDHWTLTVDVDEFLVYPFCDSRPLRAMTDWMDSSSIRTFSAMLLDMYPKGPIDALPYREGQDPLEIAAWFDSGNYVIETNPRYKNLWIQGGPRMRAFFTDNPHKAPALNKIPLVKWKRHYVYLDSTHMLLPRGLNRVYAVNGGEMTSGCLLHTKFLHTFVEKSKEEFRRKQHFDDSIEYKAYARRLQEGQLDLWHEWSEKYVNWRQLEILGLMSKGNWA